MPFVSLVAGVSQPVSHAVRPSSAFVGTLSHCEPSFQSRVVGVGQAANAAAPAISGSPFRSPPLLVWPPVIVFGVGQPVRRSATDGSDGLNCPCPSV
jgi:hypothetical protein